MLGGRQTPSVRAEADLCECAGFRWSDERAVAAALEVALRRAANRPPTSRGPSREEMLEIIAAAEAHTGDEAPVAPRR